jgi:tripartite-type tricarboxylate transporter receptor subunit TctC
MTLLADCPRRRVMGENYGRKMVDRRKFLALAGLVSTASVVRTGHTQPADARSTWPNHPIRLIVPFAPGGAADRIGRMVAEPLARALGQPIVVENRTGGGGTPAALATVTAPADGYTLFLGAPGQMVLNGILLRDLPYDPQRDLQPVSLLYRSAYALGVHPGVPAHSLAELIALAKARPGAFAYATAGSGSGPHLAGALLAYKAGIRIEHVPYRGSALAIQDVVAGHVPISIDSIDVIVPQIHSGAVRGLAVTSRDRSNLAPDLPAITETLPGYDVTVYTCIAVRAGTPRPIVDRLSREIHAIVRAQAFVEQNAAVGATTVGGTPREVEDFLRAEAAKWRPIIAQAGIRVD